MLQRIRDTCHIVDPVTMQNKVVCCAARFTNNFLFSLWDKVGALNLGGVVENFGLQPLQDLEHHSPMKTMACGKRCCHTPLGPLSL